RTAQRSQPWPRRRCWADGATERPCPARSRRSATAGSWAYGYFPAQELTLGRNGRQRQLVGEQNRQRIDPADVADAVGHDVDPPDLPIRVAFLARLIQLEANLPPAIRVHFGVALALLEDLLHVRMPVELLHQRVDGQVAVGVV